MLGNSQSSHHQSSIAFDAKNTKIPYVLNKIFSEVKVINKKYYIHFLKSLVLWKSAKSRIRRIPNLSKFWFVKFLLAKTTIIILPKIYYSSNGIFDCQSYLT